MKAPRASGAFRAEAQSPFAAENQVAGSVSGILDQTGHCGAGLALRVDPGDRAPHGGAAAVATHMAHRAGSRKGLKNLSSPFGAVRIFIDLN